MRSSEIRFAAAVVLLAAPVLFASRQIRRHLTTKRLLLSLLTPALTLAFPLTSNTVQAQPPLYLALGDSSAVGDGSSDPMTLGYVPMFHEHLKGLLALPELELMNLGVSGQTSIDLIVGGQLELARMVLEERNGDGDPSNDVEVVTLSIGGNDVVGLFLFWLLGPPFGGGCAGTIPRPPGCQIGFDLALSAFAENFDFILHELRTAAGPKTPIIVATIYNPLVEDGPVADRCFFGFPVAIDTVNVILEGGKEFGGIRVPRKGGFNDLIRAIAGDRLDGLVADLVPRGRFPALLGPSHIDPDGPPEAPGCVHPNDDGYEIIFNEFKNAFADEKGDFDEQ